MDPGDKFTVTMMEGVTKMAASTMRRPHLKPPGLSFAFLGAETRWTPMVRPSSNWWVSLTCFKWSTILMSMRSQNFPFPQTVDKSGWTIWSDLVMLVNTIMCQLSNIVELLALLEGLFSTWQSMIVMIIVHNAALVSNMHLLLDERWWFERWK